MDTCKRSDASLDRFLEAVERVGFRQTHHGLHVRQQVFRAVFGLASKNRNLRLASLALSNVAGDLGSADHFAFRTSHRGNGQRDVDQASILALTHGLIMLDAITALDAYEKCILLM